VKSGIWGKLRGHATLELWDFGAATETLDWSRFPGPGSRMRFINPNGGCR
jgi:hypothetical protein